MFCHNTYITFKKVKVIRVFPVMGNLKVQKLENWVIAGKILLRNSNMNTVKNEFRSFKKKSLIEYV